MLTGEELIELQNQVDQVEIDRTLVDYVVQIAAATREHEHIQIGVSPRGTLAMIRASKASAMLNGRDYVVPDDITDHVLSVFTHRIVSKTHLHDSDGITNQRIMQQVIETVTSPV